LVCHFLAIAWAVWWVGGLRSVDFGWGAVDLGWAGTALMVVYLVWFLNLFNFMDGIDGIAGSQALVMSASAAFLLYLGGSGPGAVLPLALLAAAVLGFLPWNWPPARIFLGDVGSGYLGYTLGVFALWTVVMGWLSAWVWLILGGAFLADATVTLIVRARAGATLAEAHRSHAYQRLSRQWNGHRPVTLAFAAVNLMWLGPWGVVATLWPRYGAFCALMALTPLFAVAALLGAGRPGDIGRGGRLHAE
jgi:Fuc2NAc and GlcNAc transferase